MLIKSIRLNGYKRFHDMTIDLGDKPSRIVALVGPNGCGKSSVFDGLLFLQNRHDTVGSTGTLNWDYHSLHREPNYNWKQNQRRICHWFVSRNKKHKK